MVVAGGGLFSYVRGSVGHTVSNLSTAYHPDATFFSSNYSVCQARNIFGDDSRGKVRLDAKAPLGLVGDDRLG